MNMKKISILCYVILFVLVFAESASAGSQIDTSNIYIMAYYKASPEISLSTAIQEFDKVTESTGQYVEGELEIWHNYMNGRSTGIPDYEIRNGNITNISFSTNVTVRVKSDGWIVAWLTNDQNSSDMIFWNDIDDPNKKPTDTTLGQAIWRITNRIGATYDKNSIKYYSYRYPEANRLIIGGKKSSSTYYFLIPSTIPVYEINMLWSVYLNDYQWPGYPVNCYNYGTIKLDNTSIYDKNTTNACKGLYESAIYSQSISKDIQRDIRHAIFSQTSGWGSNGQTSIKSAVMLLYKSG